MDVIIYSFNLNISPKMSYGVLECDIIMKSEIILGLYKCNYSLTVKELKLHLAL